jgi:hypothetical protein
MVFDEPSYEISRKSKVKRRKNVHKFAGCRFTSSRSKIGSRNSRLEGNAEDIEIPVKLYSSALPESKLFVLFDPLGRKCFASLAADITGEVHFISGHRTRVFDLERHSAVF